MNSNYDELIVVLKELKHTVRKYGVTLQEMNSEICGRLSHYERLAKCGNQTK